MFGKYLEKSLRVEENFHMICFSQTNFVDLVNLIKDSKLQNG